MTFSGITFKGQ